jgi:hypothetical protein
VFRGDYLARSIIGNKDFEGIDRISEKLLTCGLKEGIKAVSFLYKSIFIFIFIKLYLQQHIFKLGENLCQW